MATLFRPVGQKELDLVEASGWREFPPAVGYVLRFEVDDAYLAGHEVHEAGGRALQEYWIPSEELDEFNAHILGVIEIIAEYRGDPPVRIR